MSTLKRKNPFKPPLSLGDDNDDDDDDDVVGKKNKRPLSPYKPAKNGGNGDCAAGGGGGGEGEGDEEDDYMNMVIQEPVELKESFTQKIRRQEREAEIRANPKSKSELAALEKSKRNAALSKSLLEDQETVATNKGLKMMKMMGYTVGSGLGKKLPINPLPLPPPPPPPTSTSTSSTSTSTANTTTKTQTPPPPPPPPPLQQQQQQPRLDPIPIIPKADRSGIGHHNHTTTTSTTATSSQPHSPKMTPEEYRETLRQQREQKRQESLLHASQKICEQLASSSSPPSPSPSTHPEAGAARTAKNETETPVYWRSLIQNRNREAQERVQKHILSQRPLLENIHRHNHHPHNNNNNNNNDVNGGGGGALLPGYHHHRDLEFDAEDGIAIGLLLPSLPSLPVPPLSSAAAGVGVGYLQEAESEDEAEGGEGEEDEDEDEELKAFESLPVEEKVKLVVGYLRERWWYCFWCKYRYESEVLEGCPGVEEDMHG